MRLLIHVFLFVPAMLFLANLDCRAETASELRITSEYSEGVFRLVHSDRAANIYIDSSDAEVIHLAAEALRKDVEMVTGVSPTLHKNTDGMTGHAILIGTAGRSSLIDRLDRAGKLPLDRIRNQWETFAIVVVEQPFENVPQALIIAGSDRRGTAFGVFALSAMLGVSPWYWWADVTPSHKDALYVTPGERIDGPPSVKFRGIFLNDEDWGLKPWAAQHMDPDIRDIGPNTYARIFELLLRLKANYIWPAMHPCTKAFYYYPNNPKVADRYGIVVGSSHCEPMLRNNVFEWKENFKQEYAQEPGEWRYDRNSQQIFRYWEDRTKQASAFESVFTVGMRGIHDSGMPGPDSQDEKLALLQKVIADQRTLLGNYINPSVQNIPQIFCPYKEVLQLYQAGLNLPDDVTIVWADDNHGYIRQLSTPDEQQRSGASGVYYHLSYWGAPQDYLWLSSISPSLISYEMSKAYHYGASRLWVFNVGDIKPAEMETEFALELAWNIDEWPPEKTHLYAEVWAAKSFGESFAEPIAQIKAAYYRLAQAGKPEHLAALTFSESDAEARLRDYQEIANNAQTLSEKIPPPLQDAYFQLILYPVQCARLMNEKILFARKSLALAQQGDDRALEYAQNAERAFEQIQILTKRYNEEIAHGKWNGMMSWHPRDREVFKMPMVATAAMISDAKMSSRLAANKPNAIADRASHESGNEREAPKLAISAVDYTKKLDRPDAYLQMISGLGLDGAGLTLMPFDAQSLAESNIRDAAFMEYKIDPPLGVSTVIVKCLPTHRIHEGRGLRYAISVNDEPPQVVDVHSPSPSETWGANVLRGYSIGQTSRQPDPKTNTIRIYLLDPGLVIDRIELF